VPLEAAGLRLRRGFIARGIRSVPRQLGRASPSMECLEGVRLRVAGGCGVAGVVGSSAVSSESLVGEEEGEAVGVVSAVLGATSSTLSNGATARAALAEDLSRARRCIRRLLRR
jgi:hypothetical protein